jgi:hypothetical protein
MKIQTDWLTQRVENAPTSYDQTLPDRAGLRNRMAWQKLQRQATAGDEVWAFSDPSSSSKQGRLTGYALVRDGEIVESVTLA